MSTIKVLHVIARMNVGGTARYVGELVENIPNSKLATGYIQGLEIEDQIMGSMTVFRIEHLGRKLSLINDYKAWKELNRVVRTYKPTIIHTHTFKAGLIGRFVRGNFKRVHTFHGHLFNDTSFSQLEKLVIRVVERILSHRTDVLVSVGKKVGKELRDAKIGITKEWISIAPGVEEIPTIEKLDALNQLQLFESKLIIGWMARMVPVKNPQLLLDVAVLLPNIEFVMAGGGELLEQMRTSAPQNVKVIGWTNPSIFLSAVDLIVSTSENEGMPIGLIEAQLAGKPVIATNVGSSSEVVEHEVTGFVVNKTAKALIAAINRLESDPALIKLMGTKAKIRATKEFNLQTMLKSHRELYLRCSIE
jgi:glycosyltransferase involved in cell wall biosynthesis